MRPRTARGPCELYEGCSGNGGDNKGRKKQEGPNAGLWSDIDVKKRGAEPKDENVAKKMQQKRGQDRLGKVGEQAVNAAGSEIVRPEVKNRVEAVRQVDQNEADRGRGNRAARPEETLEGPLHEAAKADFLGEGGRACSENDGAEQEDRGEVRRRALRTVRG